MRREPEAYLWSFLDEESSTRYIYGGVAFFPPLVKLVKIVGLCCTREHPTAPSIGSIDPLPTFHISVCVMTTSVHRASDDRLARALQSGIPLARLRLEAR